MTTSNKQQRSGIRIILLVFYFLQSFFSFSQTSSKPAHLAPVPQFSAMKLCSGDTAFFINQTHDGVTYKWILSSLDTNNLTESRLDSATTFNYQYFFNLAGTYILTLEADNGHLTSITRTLAVYSDTKAIFDFMPCINQFVNISTCADQFYWDFGDNNSSNNAMPVHQYSDTGIYKVKLIAMKGINSDSAKTLLPIYQLGYQSALFSSTLNANVFSGQLLDSIGPYFSVTWNFGDGSPTETTTAVTHTYPNADDIYWISVYTGNACGLDFKDTAVQVWSIVGLSEKNFNQITVSPNPFGERINIRGAQNCDYTFCNSYGQRIAGGTIVSDQYELSGLNDQVPGVYILEIRNSSGTKRIKLLKLAP